MRWRQRVRKGLVVGVCGVGRESGFYSQGNWNWSYWLETHVLQKNRPTMA